MPPYFRISYIHFKIFILLNLFIFTPNQRYKLRLFLALNSVLFFIGFCFDKILITCAMRVNECYLTRYLNECV